MRLEHTEWNTPVGAVLAVGDREKLVALGFADGWERLRRGLHARFGAIELVAAGRPRAIRDRLHAYFRGELDALTALVADPGGTPFQRRVWGAMREIPPGARVTYRELAATVGRPRAARAVGAASGANPVALVIPCHRVVGSDGRLCGYAYGEQRKRWLLGHEAAGPG